MLTLFTIPKAFDGEAADAQRNALASWLQLGGDVQVVLVGNEAGVAEAAAAAGADVVDAVARGEGGTPRLDDAFARVDALARHPLRCFVNADVILLDDFLPAVRLVTGWTPRSLAVGQTTDVPVAPGTTARAGWQRGLRASASRDGVRRGAGAVDYFVFPGDLYQELPAFVVGRAGFDNWLIWRARAQDVPVVDLTEDVLALHQSHGYGHLAGGKLDAYLGAEAARNVELAGGPRNLYSIADASHRLRGGRVRRNPWAAMRVGDRVRRARWKLGLDRTP